MRFFVGLRKKHELQLTQYSPDLRYIYAIGAGLCIFGFLSRRLTMIAISHFFDSRQRDIQGD